jgi:hypothetical protein
MQPDSGDAIRVANTADKGRLSPSMVIGKPLLEKDDQSEIAFDVGKRLAYLRPERYVSYALSTLPRIENAFAAALTASGRPATPGVNGSDEATKLAAHIRSTVPNAVLEHVGAVARKLDDSPVNGVVTGWRTATDLTANRVGLILCNDFETAAKQIATEDSTISTMPAKERLRDLLAYSVSESYFAVRRHLALTVAEGQ